MKKLTLLLLALFALVAFTKTSFSQDEDMKKWMAAMTPGDEHKMMAKSVGNWKFKSTFWMDPKSDAQTSEGTAVGEMIMGGRYLVFKVQGMMMGMPFEGMEIDAYDNVSKKYYSTWIDNFGTGMMWSTGAYDKTTKTLTSTGSYNDPLTGNATNMRQTVKFNDDGSMTMEMFGPDKSGTEFKNMHIDYSK